MPTDYEGMERAYNDATFGARFRPTHLVASGRLIRELAPERAEALNLDDDVFYLVAKGSITIWPMTDPE